MSCRMILLYCNVSLCYEYSHVLSKNYEMQFEAAQLDISKGIAKIQNDLDI